MEKIGMLKIMDTLYELNKFIKVEFKFKIALSELNSLIKCSTSTMLYYEKAARKIAKLLKLNRVEVVNAFCAVLINSHYSDRKAVVMLAIAVISVAKKDNIPYNEAVRIVVYS